LDFLQLLIGGIAQGCVYGLIALGFVLIYKATEQVNFAQGDFIMVGAYIALTLVVEIRALGWGLHAAFWIALFGSMLIMAGLGFLLDRFVFRLIIGQPAFAVVILTIALGFVMRAAAGAIWGEESKTMATPFAQMKVDLGGAILGAESLAVIAGTVILAAALFAFFRYTRIGVAMQASSQNQLAAYYMGIPVKIVFSLVWAISAAVSAVAGILLAPITTVDPQMGLQVGLKAFAAAVIGGFGSLPGALLAGLLIGILEPFVKAYGSRVGLPDGVTTVFPYILMLAVLIARPQGLFAQIYRKKV
jgi:branched-chain amino acid transport system permease protein